MKSLEAYACYIGVRNLDFPHRKEFKMSKNIYILLAIVLSVGLAAGLASSQAPGEEPQQSQTPCGSGRAGGGMMGGGMMGQQGMMHGAMGGGMMDEMMPGMMGCGAMCAHGGPWILGYGAELGLTEEQTEKLRSIWHEHKKESIRKSADSKLLTLDLNEFLSKGEYQKARKQITQISALTAEIMEGRLSALEKSEKVLTKEQLKKLKELRKSPRGPMMHHEKGKEEPTPPHMGGRMMK